MPEDDSGPYAWGVLVNRWRDEGLIAHLIKGDGSPACGVPYFASTQYDVGRKAKCRRCERIAKRKGV